MSYSMSRWGLWGLACQIQYLETITMTAATEAQAIVASAAAKVEQGTITKKDLEELRKLVRENPEVSMSGAMQHWRHSPLL